jgi:hypothetical protein
VTAPTVYHTSATRTASWPRSWTRASPSSTRRSPTAPSRRIRSTAFRRRFERYVAYGVAHPAHYRLLFQRRLPKPTPSALASYARLERMVADIATAGRLRVPVEDAAPAFWAAAHGVTTLVIAGFLPKSAAAIQHVRDSLVAHLTTPPPRAARGGAR